MPKLIKNSTELVLNEKVLSRSDILSEMRLYHWDVEDCLGLPENYLSPHAGGVYTLRPKIRYRDVEDKKPGKIVDFPQERLIN